MPTTGDLLRRLEGRSESVIQQQVLRYLRARGIVVWKGGGGAFRLKDAKGKMRYARFGTVGQADLIGLLPGGRLLAIEVKTLKGRCTPEQRLFLDTIAQQGGAAMVVHSVAECHEYITKIMGGPYGAPQPAPRNAAPAPGHDRRAGLLQAPEPVA